LLEVLYYVRFKHVHRADVCFTYVQPNHRLVRRLFPYLTMGVMAEGFLLLTHYIYI
jgi:hypothetical protein